MRPGGAREVHFAALRIRRPFTAEYAGCTPVFGGDAALCPGYYPLPLRGIFSDMSETDTKLADLQRTDMLQLTDKQIRKLESWQSIDSRFDYSSSREIINPLIGRLHETPDIGVEIISTGDGFLQNYYSFFVFDKRLFPIIMDETSEALYHYDGVCVYLSLLSPYSACGRSSMMTFIDKSSQRWTGSALPDIDLDTIIDSPNPNEQIEQIVFATVANVGYQLLTRVELSQLLPDGVVPYEYCLGAEPWDKLFHVLFSNTD
jgi:hypothetical protein